MFESLKVGDTVTVQRVPENINAKVSRITPKYLVLDNGDKFRIADGLGSGITRGRLLPVVASESVHEDQPEPENEETEA